MSDVVALNNRILAMGDADIAQVRALEAASLANPQVEIPTHHVLHAGMYARTITVPAGVVLTGALIKCATILIINGDAIVYRDGERVEFTGHNVLACSAHRMMAIAARTDTDMTMIFATHAASVEEAEWQFTDEADRLFSRLPGARNTIVVTGE